MPPPLLVPPQARVTALQLDPRLPIQAGLVVRALGGPASGAERLHQLLPGAVTSPIISALLSLRLLELQEQLLVLRIR